MPAPPSTDAPPPAPPPFRFDPLTVAAATQHRAALRAAAGTVDAINAATHSIVGAASQLALRRATAAAGSAIAATAVSLSAIDGSVRERAKPIAARGATDPAQVHPTGARGGTDAALLALLRARALDSIADVLALMDQIEALLSPEDGLARFNHLYRLVSEGVLASRGVVWEDRPWIERLDVIFANLYFDGVEACLAGSPSAPAAWRALMDRRHDRGIAPIQFALAGMSAHINRDLAPAVAFTWDVAGTGDHARSTAQFRDFKRVNTILDAVEPAAMRALATGLFEVLSEIFGEADDWAALAVIHGARDLAWSHAQILAELGAGTEPAALYLESLDLTAAGCAIAAMVPSF